MVYVETLAGDIYRSGKCVGVARDLPGLVAVRDSKNPAGAKLIVPQETGGLFIKSMRA